MKWLKTALLALLLVGLMATAAAATEPEVPAGCTYDGSLTTCVTVMDEGEQQVTETRQRVIRTLGCAAHRLVVDETRTVTRQTVITITIVKAGSPWDTGPIIWDYVATDSVVTHATEWTAAGAPYTVGSCGKGANGR